MAELTRAEVLRRRLSAQGLLGDRARSPEDVVGRLACVQSQEHAYAFWSLGMRLGQSTLSQVRHAFDEGRFVRTHILRPTWHFVRPEDIEWILRLTAPRIQQIAAGRYRELGLDIAVRDRSARLIVELLSGGHYLTRREIGQELAGSGIDIDGQRLTYLVMNAELEGLICSGPMRAAQHTYAVLAERMSGHQPEQVVDPTAELLRRFLLGHGPASVKDFARWSSLTLTQTRQALAAIESDCQSAECEGETVWFLPQPAAARPSRTYLFPFYDEVILSHPMLNFAQAEGHPIPQGKDPFCGPIINGLTDIGVWKRVLKRDLVQIGMRLAPSAQDQRTRDRLESAIQAFADFLGVSTWVIEDYQPTARW